MHVWLNIFGDLYYTVCIFQPPQTCGDLPNREAVDEAKDLKERVKHLQEQIKMAGEERDHLKALTMQFQDQTNHQKHEVS